jgi:RNA polymerase sigma-70 factor, ECF subfamily
MDTVLLVVGGDMGEQIRPDGDAVEDLEDAPAAGLADPESTAADAPPMPWQPPSWEQVVADHGDRVFRLAYRLTGNKHDAEDLTQEVFVRVFRSLSTYTPGSFEGWLHRITTNLFLDQVRRRNRIRFDALPDDASDKLEGREPSPEHAVVDGVLEADVQAALDALPPDFRAAVVLADVEGLTYEEIAETLDIKLGTVRSRIHRGRSQLRAALSSRLRPGGGLGPALPGAGG